MQHGDLHIPMLHLWSLWIFTDSCMALKSTTCCHTLILWVVPTGVKNLFFFISISLLTQSDMKDLMFLLISSLLSTSTCLCWSDLSCGIYLLVTRGSLVSHTSDVAVTWAHPWHRHTYLEYLLTLLAHSSRILEISVDMVECFATLCTPAIYIMSSLCSHL